MDFITQCVILGFVAVLLIVIYIFKTRAANAFLKENTDVPELYLQKAVDNKLRTLNHTLRQSISSHKVDTSTNNHLLHQELLELRDSYKEQKINLKTYNHKLDKLISKLN